MADYYLELDYQAQARKHYEATEAAYYDELQREYEAYLRTQLYRDKCILWLDYTQHGTPIPDWYYYP